MTRAASRAARLLVTLAVVALVSVVAVTGWRTWHDHANPFASGDECRVEVGGHTVSLDREQARWAGLIVATSVARGMPARAASIGLATAYQESGLYNLRSGDRDSVGLFQQRPSQGWGTHDELLDPVYATNAFYDALNRVANYEDLPITVAAQEVQRSAFPSAYAAHESDARAVASALTGFSAHSFSCSLEDGSGGGSVRAVDRDLGGVFPGLKGDDTASGLSIAVPDQTRGWAVAQYLVSQAHRLGLSGVSYDGRTWRAGADGWARASPQRAGVVRVAVAA